MNWRSNSGRKSGLTRVCEPCRFVRYELTSHDRHEFTQYASMQRIFIGVARSNRATAPLGKSCTQVRNTAEVKEIAEPEVLHSYTDRLQKSGE